MNLYQLGFPDVPLLVRVTKMVKVSVYEKVAFSCMYVMVIICNGL